MLILEQFHIEIKSRSYLTLWIYKLDGKGADLQGWIRMDISKQLGGNIFISRSGRKKFLTYEELHRFPRSWKRF